MNLYIEIDNGQAKNSPAFEENLVQAFGAVPESWKPFVRVAMPKIEVYEILESDQPIYLQVDGTWTNSWAIRAMTDAEKTAKQQAAITAFNSREQASNWAAWTLDEATCTMQPPTPRPEFVEGVLVLWCGADNAWKEAPARPDGQYTFDFLAWNWIEVTNV
jgi:hypothetical protein